MDVETTQAIEEVGSRIDRLDSAMNQGFASVRSDMEREFASVRSDIAGLRVDLETNWSRTRALFESVHTDIQMLAGHVADLASRRPRS